MQKVALISILCVVLVFVLWSRSNPIISRITKDLKSLEPNLDFVVLENKLNDVTFTLGKSIIYICTDTKEYNTLLYVGIHELAHVKNNSYGHDMDFINTFKELLNRAIRLGIYIDTDYKITPKEYCNIIINSF